MDLLILKPKKMNEKSSKSPEKIIKEIKRKTRRKFSSEEKIRIVIEGIRGEDSIAAICRREGINPNLYYRWSKDFLEAGKKRLQGDTQREANTNEVVKLKRENTDLKMLVAELFLESRLIKKKPQPKTVRAMRAPHIIPWRTNSTKIFSFFANYSNHSKLVNDIALQDGISLDLIFRFGIIL